MHGDEYWRGSDEAVGAGSGSPGGATDWSRRPRPTPPAGAPPDPDPGQIVLGYAGPPPTTPPPYAWQPARVVEPAPPRQLPPQDHAALDLVEERARTLTYGIGVIVGAILLIVLCALCGRTLF